RAGGLRPAEGGARRERRGAYLEGAIERARRHVSNAALANASSIEIRSTSGVKSPNILEQLHEWVVGLAAWREAHGLPGGAVNESTRVIDESLINIGATIMGPQLARRYITFFPKTRALSHS